MAAGGALLGADDFLGALAGGLGGGRVFEKATDSRFEGVG